MILFKTIIELKRIAIFFVLIIIIVPIGDRVWTKDDSENTAKTSSVATDASQFSFYAVYDNLVNTESHNVNCEHAAMSADGSKMIFSCRNDDTNDLLLYTINSDGTNLTPIALPGELTYIMQVVINKDGTRAFFHQGSEIYKVVGSTAAKIYDYEDHPEPGGFYSIRITATGEHLYLHTATSYRTGSIWKMDHTGAGIVKVFEYKDVQRDGGTGAGIVDFDISDDAGILAFILKGYDDSENKFHYKYELFTLDGSGFHQLTNDNENILKDFPAISGDGSTIVFSSAGPDNKWYSIQSDGSNKIPLEDKYSDVFGPVLNFDGTKMFYNDDGTEGGRLVYTDGTKRIDLFPHTYPYYLNIHGGVSVTEDGNMISFIFRYGYDYYGLYVGYLNPSLILFDGPAVESINFNLPVMPNNNPEAEIVLNSQISHPQGLDDILATATDILLDGIRKPPGSSETPVRFYHAMNDEGNEPDQTANDGIFSSVGKPGPNIDQHKSVIVRVGAMDMNRNAVVADTILYIGESAVNVEQHENIPAEFNLYQNYPNPFNPTTKIGFRIADFGFVTLKVYNVHGEEIVTLVNEEKTAGSYEVIWEAKNLASGIYFYKMKAGNFVQAKKMVLIK
jgi:Tol biopolymer transport system component